MRDIDDFSTVSSTEFLINIEYVMCDVIPVYVHDFMVSTFDIFSGFIARNILWSDG